MLGLDEGPCIQAGTSTHRGTSLPTAITNSKGARAPLCHTHLLQPRAGRVPACETHHFLQRVLLCVQDHVLGTARLQGTDDGWGGGDLDSV